MTRSPTRCRLGEQRVDRRREVGAEDQGAGGAGGDQPAQELRRDPLGVRRVGEAALLGQRAPLEPLQQRHAERTDRPGPAGSARACRRARAAARRRAGRRPRRRGGRRATSAKSPRVDDHAVDDQQPASSSLRSSPPVERVVGGVEDPGPVDRHRAGPRLASAQAGGRSSAATPSAIVAGSLPARSGRRSGSWIRAIARRRGPRPQAPPEPAPLRRRPDQPDRAEVGAAQRGVAERRSPRRGRGSAPARGCRAGPAPSTSSGTGEWWTWTRGRAVVEAAPAARGELVGARVDEVQLEVVPGQDPGQLETDVTDPEDRHRRARPAAARAAA